MEKKTLDVMWVLIGLIAAFVSIGIIALTVFGGPFYGSGYYASGMMGYGFYGMGIFMPVILAFSVILVIVFVYFLVGLFRQPVATGHASSMENAAEIARQRYARGEIQEEEYRTMMENLRR